MQIVKEEKKPATLKDVADAANLSLVSVSRALRHPDSVKEKTREKVHEAIRKVGYVPNLTARSLVSSRSNVIGLVVPFLRSSLFADLAQALMQELAVDGRQLLLSVSNRSVELEEAAIKTFIGRQADAIVVTGFTHSEDCRNLLRGFNGPVIETWNINSDPVDLTVGYNNAAAAAEMTSYLLDRGADRIAIVGGDFENNDQGQSRFEGFNRVLAAAGKSLIPEHIIQIPNPTTIESGYKAILQLMRSNPAPDAVFFHAELPAQGAIMACHENGISVPDDVAIAGFGDIALSGLLPVPLTTIKIRAEEIGRQCGVLLRECLDDRQPSSRSIDVGYELIKRKSA